MGKTRPRAIVLMLITTLLTSTAQLLYKIGVEKIDFTEFLTIITNMPLLAGLSLYVVGAVLMIIALRGGELSVLYPIIATSYIWVGLFSWYLFGEALNVLRWMGIFSIFFGVVFIGFGSKNSGVTS